MHMSDALITPVVGGVMYAAAIGTAVAAVKTKARTEGESTVSLLESKLPLMGVAGALVFAAQMINFSIPGTGSSGHIGGGLLLAAMLGGGPAYIVMGAVLLIQALFFADGGLLAFGCNWFNMGMWACFLAYPLIFKPLYKAIKNRRIGIILASLAASIVGLQLGAFSVVIQTVLSGRTDLPFGTFVLFMQPIHLAIGIGEGLITGVILAAVYSARPQMLDFADAQTETGNGKTVGRRAVIIGLACLTIITGVVVSSFASGDPDGLEWSIEKTTDQETEADSPLHEFFSGLQEKLAFLPDYSFKQPSGESSEEAGAAVDAGTAVSGIAGAAIVLCAVIAAGAVITIIRKKSKNRA